MSWVETCANTVIGYIVAITVQYLTFPWFGIEINFWQQNGIGVIFMVVSIARGYCLRRFFNWLWMRAA
jgi:hypothetical protein